MYDLVQELTRRAYQACSDGFGDRRVEAQASGGGCRR